MTDLGKLERMVAALKEVCKDEYEEVLFGITFMLAFSGAFRIGKLVTASKWGD